MIDCHNNNRIKAVGICEEGVGSNTVVTLSMRDMTSNAFDEEKDAYCDKTIENEKTIFSCLSRNGDGSPLYRYSVYSRKPDKWFVHLSIDTVDARQVSDLTNTIISSFQFMNTTIKPFDISTWKTYMDENKLFSFRYPSHWITNGIQIAEEMNGTNQFTYKGMYVYLYENAGHLTALEFLDTLYYKDFAGDTQTKGIKDTFMEEYRKNRNEHMTTRNGKAVYVEQGGDRPYITPIMIDGKPATMIDELIMPSGSQGSGVWIPVGSKGLLLQSIPSADAEEEQKIFEQILATFKFLK